MSSADQDRRIERMLKESGYEDAARSYKAERRREEYLLRTYGLTAGDYFNLDDGCCSACGDMPERLHVDHCHRTGQVRGLLCTGCNLTLGRAHDDIRRLQATVQRVEDRAARARGLIEYLRKFAAETE